MMQRPSYDVKSLSHWSTSGASSPTSRSARASTFSNGTPRYDLLPPASTGPLARDGSTTGKSKSGLTTSRFRFAGQCEEKHRITLLEIMERILSLRRELINDSLAAPMVELCMSDMTREKVCWL